jgi:hypothetical protein
MLAVNIERLRAQRLFSGEYSRGVKSIRRVFMLKKYNGFFLMSSAFQAAFIILESHAKNIKANASTPSHPRLQVRSMK